MPSHAIHGTFFPAAFRVHVKGSKRASRNRDRCNRHIRRSWAQAEMFISNQLSRGYHPDFIEDRVRDEINASEISGFYRYCPCFLEFGMRILGNMRRNKQFVPPANVNINIEESERVKIVNGEYERSYSYKQKFQDPNLVGQYGMDADMQRTIEAAGALDKETELELQKMREALHKEAEGKYHSRKQDLIQGGRAETINSSEVTSRRSRSRTPTGRKNEPSIADSRQSDRRSSRSSHHQPRLLESRVHARSQMSHTDSRASHHTLSIAPSDSISQAWRHTSPRSAKDHAYDLSRLRPASPAGTSHRAKPGRSLVSSSRDARTSSSRTDSRHDARSSRKDGFDMGTLGRALVQIAENPSQFQGRSRSRSRETGRGDGTSHIEGSRRGGSRSTADTKSRHGSPSRLEARIGHRRQSSSLISQSTRSKDAYRGFGKDKSTWRDVHLRNEPSTPLQRSQICNNTGGREKGARQDHPLSRSPAPASTSVRDRSQERHKPEHRSRVASTTDSTLRGPREKHGHRR